MANGGKKMIDDIDLETRMAGWSEPEKFLARQIMEIKRSCRYCEGVTPKISKKQVVAGGGYVALLVILAEIIKELLSV